METFKQVIYIFGLAVIIAFLWVKFIDFIKRFL